MPSGTDTINGDSLSLKDYFDSNGSTLTGDLTLTLVGQVQLGTTGSLGIDTDGYTLTLQGSGAVDYPDFRSSDSLIFDSDGRLYLDRKTGKVVFQDLVLDQQGASASGGSVIRSYQIGSNQTMEFEFERCLVLGVDTDFRQTVAVLDHRNGNSGIILRMKNLLYYGAGNLFQYRHDGAVSSSWTIEFDHVTVIRTAGSGGGTTEGVFLADTNNNSASEPSTKNFTAKDIACVNNDANKITGADFFENSGTGKYLYSGNFTVTRVNETTPEAAFKDFDGTIDTGNPIVSETSQSFTVDSTKTEWPYDPAKLVMIGDQVVVSNASNASYNGTYEVIEVDNASIIKFDLTGSLDFSATGDIEIRPKVIDLTPAKSGVLHDQNAGSGTLNNDLTANPRPQGEGFDIGALELYQGQEGFFTGLYGQQGVF